MKTKRGGLIVIAVVRLLVINEYRSRTLQEDQISALRSEVTRLRERQTWLATQAARPPLVLRTEPAGAPEPATAAAASTPPPAADGTAGPPMTSDRRWEDEARDN